MDFEKYTYGMHEFVLSRNCCKPCLSITLKVSAFFVFLLLPFFLYGNFAYVSKSSCLEPIISSQYVLDPLSNLNETSNGQIIKPEDILDVYVQKHDSKEINLADESSFYAHFEFSGSDYIVSMNESTKKAKNFTYHTIMIDSTCYSRSTIARYLIDTFLGFDSILVNEFLTSMKGYNATFKNMQNQHHFKISNETMQDIQDFSNSNVKLVLVVFNIIKILFGLFLIFTVTAIHIRVFYIYFPVWFFLGTERNTRLQREAIRQYSWIGIYYHTLQGNGKGTFWIFLSQYLCYLLFGRLVSAVEVYWNFLLFDKYCPRTITGEFCGLIYWAELLSILFVRTRTSLKFIPRICVLLLTIYVYYFQHTVYAFYGLGLWILGFSLCVLFTSFILIFEKPALHWDQTYHYTPSLTCPRMLFSPVFSLTWMHDIPPLWTMFYPVFGRSHFSTRELALVNNDQTLLRQILNEARERGVGFDQDFAPIGEAMQDSPVQIEIPPMNEEEVNQEISDQNLIRNEEGASNAQ